MKYKPNFIKFNFLLASMLRALSVPKPAELRAILKWQ